MRKQSKILVAFGIAVVIIACTNFKNKNIEILIPDFDSRLWKEDSISCNGYRSKVANTLIENKKLIQGKSKEEIKTFLGSPNVEYSSYRYFIEKGVQCLGHINKNGYDSLETASIVIDFDTQNKVKDVGNIVP
jgi:predicted methyltransferase